MPRKERSVQSRSIVAAAKNYTTGRSAEKQAEAKARRAEHWQHAAWDFFDTIPEYHQGCVIIGALLSRATLYVGERQPDGTWLPTKNPAALQALRELYGGEEGQSEMLRQLGIHFSVAGEGWLVGPSGPSATADDWQIAASTEVSKMPGGEWKINGDVLPGSPLIMRLWKKHPRNPKKSDAPTRAILPVLSELLQLTKRVAAQIDSRLTGAGLMFLPSEVSFPATPGRSINPGDPATVKDSIQGDDAQGIADLLIEHAEFAIQNPESAEAMIPIIATAPGEYIEKARLITFWSELDRAAPRLREESIRRIALGMDVPPEVLLGNAGSNHWNAWLSDENSVKIHAEPLLKVITASLSTGYLRPGLEGDVGNTQDFAIMADTSQMRLRPNRSKEALELNDRLILSDEAALRENGFTDRDIMDDAGVVKALLRKVAGGSTTPEIVEAALRETGVDLEIQLRDFRPPAEERPTPSLQDHPVRELPAHPEASISDALVFAAEQIVDRALQRAGNRVRTKLGLKNSEVSANRVYLEVQMSAKDIDGALEDAWDPCYNFDFGVSSKELERCLDTYTRSLLRFRLAPSRSGIRTALELMMNRLTA